MIKALSATVLVLGVSGTAYAGQSKMHDALDELRAAKAALERAGETTDNNRDRALEHVKKAISHVQKGIDYDKKND